MHHNSWVPAPCAGSFPKKVALRLLYTLAGSMDVRGPFTGNYCTVVRTDVYVSVASGRWATRDPKTGIRIPALPLARDQAPVRSFAQVPYLFGVQYASSAPKHTSRFFVANHCTSKFDVSDVKYNYEPKLFGAQCVSSAPAYKSHPVGAKSFLPSLLRNRTWLSRLFYPILTYGWGSLHPGMLSVDRIFDEML